MSRGSRDTVKRTSGVFDGYLCFIIINIIPCILRIINRLFLGCRQHSVPSKVYPINTTSIRIIETATNYQAVIQTMTAFDAVYSGNTIEVNVPISGRTI